ncbi:unnamed protein product [Trichogramma brassicae]|uniref:Uncharacterized protein n=1 Tax=Trichogramma brassicae TaxID=86971 RepID=A0A6H5IG13_9HYME|nr:unnamed protein product [Trichogramma brassicae]
MYVTCTQSVKLEPSSIRNNNHHNTATTRIRGLYQMKKISMLARDRARLIAGIRVRKQQPNARPRVYYFIDYDLSRRWLAFDEDQVRERTSAAQAAARASLQARVVPRAYCISI